MHLMNPQLITWPGPNKAQQNHFSDVIMVAMVSQITSLTLFTQPFIQAKIKENIKASCDWPLCVCVCVWGGGEIFPTQLASNVENVFIWWHHHIIYIFHWIYSIWTWNISVEKLTHSYDNSLRKCIYFSFYVNLPHWYGNLKPSQRPT